VSATETTGSLQPGNNAAKMAEMSFASRISTKIGSVHNFAEITAFEKSIVPALVATDYECNIAANAKAA
jgi:hypothetical protein